MFVLLHTVPVLYEKYEDKIDPLAEKVMIEIKKQYAVFEEKVLIKIPRGPFKGKKHWISLTAGYKDLVVVVFSEAEWKSSLHRVESHPLVF